MPRRRTSVDDILDDLELARYERERKAEERQPKCLKQKTQIGWTTTEVYATDGSVHTIMTPRYQE